MIAAACVMVVAFIALVAWLLWLVAQGERE